MTADLSTLTRLLNNEVIRAMGLNPEGWAGRLLQPPLSRATRRFSELMAQADCIIADEGMPAAARFVLLSLVQDIRSRGLQNVPREGPLVIASNHPGSIDSMAIGACAGREDLKIIASAIPFLENLTHIREHLIFLPRQGIQARMLAVREGVRHLKAGGVLLLFARGGIDPDPSFMPEADLELSGWSRSLAIFLQRVPQTRVVTSIVSHVIDPAYMKHPLIWLRRARPDRQRLAMMIQIIQQMLGKKLDLVPHVSFGEVTDWPAGENAGDPLRAVVGAARRLLQSHLAWQS
ncbi:MAG: 1-acyl-sn-glycerol-3-phosphate acyltransferase [Chloroflexota bacterium]